MTNALNNLNGALIQALPKGEPVRARQINLATANGVLAAQFVMLNYPRRRAVIFNSAVGANIWDKKYLA